MEEKLYIGSHVSMNGPEYYLGSVKEALSYGATTFMFYTGAPQNSYRKPLDQLLIEEGRKLIKEAGLDEDKIVVHAPYIINPANKMREDIYKLSIDTIRNEIKRCEGFHVKILVLHPGSHLKLGSEIGIQSLCSALDEVFQNDSSEVKIALETMAGKGSEIGINFNEIKKIIDGCKYSDRLGVCLDTCHINDAGYDVKDFDSLLKEFDSIIGLEKLLVIHINDSKNPRGSHKDRHENIGYGTIGFETINYVVHHPLLTRIPKILETPYYEGEPPYKIEIEMLKKGVYINDWREKLL